MYRHASIDGIAENARLLSQLEAFLLSLPDDKYAAPLPILEGRSFGEHVRHILSFYELLLAGDEVVCYDARERAQTLEAHRIAAIKKLRDVLSLLHEMTRHTERTVRVRVEKGDTGNQNDFFCLSSLSRELFYVADHTIHHMFIIRVGVLAVFPTVQLPETFGIAHSTLRYRNEVHAGRSAKK